MGTQRSLTSSISIVRLKSLVRALSGGRLSVTKDAVRSLSARHRPPSSPISTRPSIHEIFGNL